MLTTEGVRRHIVYKRDGEHLPADTAERMLAALDAGAAPDYQRLLYEATWGSVPATMYHTAPTAVRAAVEAEGLRPCQPGTANWRPRPGDCVAIQASQPVGVYAAPQPDHRGMWAHWPTWDVWRIDTAALDWRPDHLNPGCWWTPEIVGPEHLTLEVTRG